MPYFNVVAVAVLTYNRVALLQKCVENVLARTSELTSEIVIWNNGSTDATGDYLDTLTDPRIQIVHCPANIGQNAYTEAFALTTADYLIDLDDDVTDAPDEWDRTLADAFWRIPNIGFLAADLVDDPHDQASMIRHHVRAHEYVPSVVNGVQILDGRAGGGCAMTSRAIYNEVGGFPRSDGATFFLEDAAYIANIEAAGYRKAVLPGLRVHHTGGPYYAGVSPEKESYWLPYRAAIRRKNRVKRTLSRIPGANMLNEHFGLFGPEEWVIDDELARIDPAEAIEQLVLDRSGIARRQSRPDGAEQIR